MALAFSSSQYGAIADSSEYNITQDLTLSCWIKVTGDGVQSAGGVEQCIISKGLIGIGETDGAYGLFYIPNAGLNSVSFGYAINTTGIVDLRIKFVGQLNTWYHIALTVSNTEYRFYVNGILQGLIDPVMGAINISALDVLINRREFTGGFSIGEAQIAQVLIFDEALTFPEVNELKDLGQSIPLNRIANVIEYQKLTRDTFVSNVLARGARSQFNWDKTPPNQLPESSMQLVGFSNSNLGIDKEGFDTSLSDIFSLGKLQDTAIRVPTAPVTRKAIVFPANQIGHNNAASWSWWLRKKFESEGGDGNRNFKYAGFNEKYVLNAGDKTWASNNMGYPNQTSNVDSFLHNLGWFTFAASWDSNTGLVTIKALRESTGFVSTITYTQATWIPNASRLGVPTGCGYGNFSDPSVPASFKYRNTVAGTGGISGVAYSAEQLEEIVKQKGFHDQSLFSTNQAFKGDNVNVQVVGSGEFQVCEDTTAIGVFRNNANPTPNHTLTWKEIVSNYPPIRQGLNLQNVQGGSVPPLDYWVDLDKSNLPDELIEDFTFFWSGKVFSKVPPVVPENKQYEYLFYLRNGNRRLSFHIRYKRGGNVLSEPQIVVERRQPMGDRRYIGRAVFDTQISIAITYSRFTGSYKVYYNGSFVSELPNNNPVDFTNPSDFSLAFPTSAGQTSVLNNHLCTGFGYWKRTLEKGEIAYLNGLGNPKNPARFLPTLANKRMKKAMVIWHQLQRGSTPDAISLINYANGSGATDGQLQNFVGQYGARVQDIKV